MEEKALPRNEFARSRIEEWLGKLRSSPRANWEALAIVTGRLHMSYSPRFKRQQYLLFTKNAVLKVRWRLNESPPGLKQGMRITVYGMIQTYALGGSLTIRNALTIKCKKSILKRALTSVLDKYGLPVSEYDAFASKRIPLPSARPLRKPPLEPDLPAWMYYGREDLSHAPLGSDLEPDGPVRPDAGAGRKKLPPE